MDYIAPSECLPSIIETNGKENGAKNAIIDPYEDLIKGHLEAEEKKKVSSNCCKELFSQLTKIIGGEKATSYCS